MNQFLYTLLVAVSWMLKYAGAILGLTLFAVLVMAVSRLSGFAPDLAVGYILSPLVIPLGIAGLVLLLSLFDS